MPAYLTDEEAAAVPLTARTVMQAIDLLGISMGGMIAQEVVALIPERIKHLILAGTGPRGT